MVKGFLASLIAGIVFIALGCATIPIFGMKGDIKDFVSSWSSGFDEFPDFSEDDPIECHDEGTYNYNLARDSVLEFGSADRISIDNASVSVYIRPTSAKYIKVAANEGSGKLMLKAKYTGEKLELEFDRPLVIFSASKRAVLIDLPQKLYDEFELEVGSGSAYIYGVEAGEFKCDIGSGELQAKDIKADKTELEIGSGDIEFGFAKGFEAEELKVKVTSGDIDFVNAAAKDYDIKVSSGDLDMCGLTGSGKLHVSSGRVEMQFDEPSADKRKFELSSGLVKAYIPDDTKAVVSAKASSGKVSVDCCGESASGKSVNIALNDGSEDDGIYEAGISSGDFKILSAEKYRKPSVFNDFPEELIVG